MWSIYAIQGNARYNYTYNIHIILRIVTKNRTHDKRTWNRYYKKKVIFDHLVKIKPRKECNVFFILWWQLKGVVRSRGNDQRTFDSIGVSICLFVFIFFPRVRAALDRNNQNFLSSGNEISPLNGKNFGRYCCTSTTLNVFFYHPNLKLMNLKLTMNDILKVKLLI